jgi:hypothetical protein
MAEPWIPAVNDLRVSNFHVSNRFESRNFSSRSNCATFAVKRRDTTVSSSSSFNTNSHSLTDPEDPPRPWTHPCNCTLIAHESCLLHWIQTSQQDSSRSANALKCPQCGATYELESDNPFVLRFLDAGNKGLSLVGKMVTVASVSAVVASFGTGEGASYTCRDFT